MKSSQGNGITLLLPRSLLRNILQHLKLHLYFKIICLTMHAYFLNFKVKLDLQVRYLIPLQISGNCAIILVAVSTQVYSFPVLDLLGLLGTVIGNVV